MTDMDRMLFDHLVRAYQDDARQSKVKQFRCPSIDYPYSFSSWLAPVESRTGAIDLRYIRSRADGDVVSAMIHSLHHTWRTMSRRGRLLRLRLRRDSPRRGGQRRVQPEVFLTTSSESALPRLTGRQRRSLHLDYVGHRRSRSPNTVSRENGERKIVVMCNVAGRDLGSVVEDIRTRVAASVPLPPGYRIEYGGQFESAEQASGRCCSWVRRW